MRLTKRQLKRIIREEYSNLKRGRLIREFGPPTAEDLADYEYDQSGKSARFSAEVQKAVQATKSHLQQRMDRNLKFVEFTLNDMFQRLSQVTDEYLEEWDGKIIYNAGRMFEDNPTPFKLTEINNMTTRFIEKVANEHGVTISWSYSWD